MSDIFYKGKRMLLVLIFFYLFYTSTEQAAVAEPSQQGTIIHITNSPVTHISPTIASSNESTVITSTTASIVERVRQLYDEAHFLQHAASVKAFVRQYTYHLSGGALCALYCALCYYLNSAVQYVEHKRVWSSWQSGLSMQELLAYDIDQLSKELILAIQMRYSNESNPTDFIFPLVEFNMHIKKEIADLQRYQKVYAACKKWHITRVVPFNTDALQSVSTYLERAVYIQTVFRHWAAHYTIAAHAQHSS